MKQLSKGPLTNFTNQFRDSMYARIDQALAEGAAPLAAFDADGTLWDTDIGENFFDYEINHCNLEALKNIKDPWAYYNEHKNPDPRVAYAWLAQINKGYSISQVKKWAQEAVDSIQPVPVLEPVKELIQFLKSRKVDVYIVTASVRWAVEPAATLLGIDHDHVLGITTKVLASQVTDEVEYPITWRDGKAEAFLKHTGGTRPLLAAGNTYGDIALIKTATHINLAVSTQSERNGLYEEEIRLANEAKKNNWLRHEFRVLP
jgi:phosphoserine phosphatase